MYLTLIHVRIKQIKKKRGQTKMSLTIKKEIDDLNDFNFWDGAVSRWEEIEELELEDAVMEIIEDLYPNGLTDTELNDLIWFGFDEFIEENQEKEND